MMRNTREALAMGQQHLTESSDDGGVAEQPMIASWHPTTLTPLVTRTDAAACRTASARFIVVGGQDANGHALQTVELVEWTLGRSWRMASLQQGRIGCAVAGLQDVIYCLGGLGSDPDTGLPVVLNSVETLSGSPTAAWQLLPQGTSALVTPRWGAASVTLPEHNCLFCVGGRDAAWQELKTVEVGTLDDGTLRFEALDYHMKLQRFGAAAVAVSAHSFMVIGGYHTASSHWTNACCLYDIGENPDNPKEGEWRDVADMPVPVDFPQAVLVESVAGSDGPHVVVSGSGGVCVQIFDVTSESWTVVEQANASNSSPSLQSSSLLLGVGPEETIVAWGRDSVATLEWETAASESSSPQAPPAMTSATTNRPTHREPEIAATNTSEKEDITSGTSQQGSNNDIPVATLVTSTHSQASYGSGTATLRHANDNAPPPPGGRKVVNQECLVEGEMAKYTGPLNAQGQRHGRGFLIWADEQGRFWPKEVSKNSFYEGEFVEDSRTGKGVMFYDKEDRVYQGSFLRGVLNGEGGQLFDGRRGLEYTGCFKKGRPSGDGQCTYNSTKQTWKGTWKHGRPIMGEWRDAYGNLLQAGTGPWNSSLAID